MKFLLCPATNGIMKNIKKCITNHLNVTESCCYVELVEVMLKYRLTPANMLVLFSDFSVLVSPPRSLLPTGRVQADLEHVMNASPSPHPWILIVKSGAKLSAAPASYLPLTWDDSPCTLR
eukprot:TRINITY_DN36750_c0_g1_i1.p1 TRINITY_DN36750_c0_g1~~TRINITY_DN36750_c0_g1_i1.p1  ORF type:complete len:120 (+),score=13.39 TRINITY_DN36750_c0_g1_i1:694-1053(+)